jgi:outer membrane protein assembly factor BamD (BamD/ComL family)
MNPDAGKLYNEGNSLLKAGNYNGAIQKYDEALKYPKIIEFFIKKG